LAGVMNPLPAPLLPSQQIESKVTELADRINSDYADVSELVMVGVLKGSFIFLADLSRKLAIPRRIEFIGVSSYGASPSADSPGAVRLLMDLRHPIDGAHVLLVEDIVDTGHTLEYLLRVLAARRPASLKTCVLVQKPERAQIDVPIDYLGFTIPDVWVVGYGLDWAERYRTLPYIGVVTPD
jgi:hypoxanthine phosphoribosyltransferase